MEIESTPKLRCYGYVRVSTKKQHNLGVSPKTQINDITEYIKFKKYELIDIKKENKGVSGAKIDKRINKFIEHNPRRRSHNYL